MDTQAKNRIIAAIHQVDARGYTGTLRISKIAKEFGFTVEDVTEVVASLIEEGIAIRRHSHHKDEFLIQRKEPPRDELGS